MTATMTLADALALADAAGVILIWRPTARDLSRPEAAPWLRGWRRHLEHELRDRRGRLAATEAAVLAVAGADDRTRWEREQNHAVAQQRVVALEALLSATA